MNQSNETVVTAEMMKQLRDLDLAAGYEPVPNFLEAKAKQLLADKAIASMDDDMKRRLRNRHKRLRRMGIPGY